MTTNQQQDLIEYLNEAVTKATVSRSYAGNPGCMCGCKGSYAEENTSVTTRRIGHFLAGAMQDPEAVNYTNIRNTGGAWELVKPNGNVIVIYLA